MVQNYIFAPKGLYTTSIMPTIDQSQESSDRFTWRERIIPMEEYVLAMNAAADEGKAMLQSKLQWHDVEIDWCPHSFVGMENLLVNYRCNAFVARDDLQTIKSLMEHISLDAIHAIIFITQLTRKRHKGAMNRAKEQTPPEQTFYFNV